MERIIVVGAPPEAMDGLEKKPAVKKILYDYLFNRILSHGMHEHSPITDEEALTIKSFYDRHKDEVLGIGQRVADIWIHNHKK